MEIQGALNVSNESYGLALRKSKPHLLCHRALCLVDHLQPAFLLVRRPELVKDENQIMICHSELRGLIRPPQESNVLYNDI